MELAGKRVTIIGLGRSAVGAARLLLREGAKPFVSDAAEGQPQWREALEALGVPFETGGHSERAVADAALLVLSPGVPPAAPPVTAARAAGKPVIGELELASRFATAPMIAVTGTNGKTTTTALLAAMVKACGMRVLLAGNNDTPLSEAVLAPAPDCYVVEVSSYQLETADTLRPWLAAVLNLTPDHLGRHGSMEEYARVKNSLFSRQRPGDVAVVNDDDPYTRKMPAPEGVALLRFSIEHEVEGTQREGSVPPLPQGMWCTGDTIYHGSEAVAAVSDVPLLGRHNLSNVLAALTLMRAGGFDWTGVLDGLRGFKPAPHRLEPIPGDGGVRFYNDSKSTNIDSLRVAVESFEAPVVLIAGGQGKGADYAVLNDLVRERVAHLVTLGQDAPLMEAAWGALVPAQRARDMADAVALAAEAAGPEGVVLLSPGCASFDSYRNFEERGEDFRSCVRQWRDAQQREEGVRP